MHYRKYPGALFLLFLAAFLPAQTAGLYEDILWLADEGPVTGRFVERKPDGRIVFQPEGEAEQVFLPDQAGWLELGPSDGNIKAWDRVTLISGTTFVGRLGGKKEKGEAVLSLDGGGTLVLLTSEIRKVERSVISAPKVSPRKAPEIKNEAAFRAEAEKLLPSETPYQFREKGWYNASYFVGLNGWLEDDYQLGLGLHTVFGYQFNRWLGVGAGTGVDAYSFDRDEVLIPVFLEVRGYATSAKTAPFYSLNAGYGFAFKNEDQFVVDAEGGLMIHPAIGLRFGADPDVNVIFDIGYRFQWATYQRELEFSGIRERREINFRRVALRFGLLF